MSGEIRLSGCTEPFEETSIPQLLQYLQRFDAPAQSQQAAVLKPIADTVSSSEPPSRVATPTPTSAASALPGRPNQDKLATAIAIFVATGLAAPSVIAGLKKDHLVKDGTSLSFLTTYARAYLTVEPIDVRVRGFHSNRELTWSAALDHVAAPRRR